MAHKVLEKLGRSGYFLLKQFQNSITKSFITGYGPLGVEFRRNFINEWYGEFLVSVVVEHDIRVQESKRTLVVLLPISLLT